MTAPVKLLEREVALQRVAAAIDAARQGHGRVVLVSGEAGIGKTTLVDAALARQPQLRVLRGACEALFAPQPLGPLHDIARVTRGALQERLHAGADRAQVFAAVLDELANSPSPTVLVIEDIHWADDATLDLLRHVGRRIEGVPAVLLLTFRDDEAGAHPKLLQVLGGWPVSSVVRVPLARLSPEGVGGLAAALGGSATGLFLATGGNPFFVTEVLASPEAGIPASVRDAVLARAAPLAPAAREVLDFASLVPRAVELMLLEQVVHPATADVLACINAGLLVDHGETLSFRHELARVAIEHAVTPLRAREWHARALVVLGEALPVAGAQGEAISLARLVHHARLAGDAAAVARLAPQAAREAAMRGARREAAMHCAAALALPIDDEATRAELLDAYAGHLFEANELEQSIGAREAAIDIHRRRGDAVRESTALAGLAMTLVRALRNTEADAASRKALALVATFDEGHEPAHAGRVFAVETYLRMLNRDHAEAITWSARAMVVAQRHGDRETLAATQTWKGAAEMFVDFARGHDSLREGLALARGVDDGGVRAADAYLMLGTAAGELFELDVAEHYLAEGIAFARERDIDRLTRYMEAWQALVDVHRGRWDAAEVLARQVIAQESAGSTNKVMAMVALGRLGVRRGDAGAARMLDEALALAQGSGTLQRIAPVRAARAEAAWLAGDFEQAAREARSIHALACAKHHAWFAGELAWWQSRAGVPCDVPAQCADPWRRALAGDWEGAAAAWSALGCPYEAARALAEGDHDAKLRALATFDAMGAAPMAARLRRELRDAGATGVPRGPRASTRASAFGLTRREHEVLTLLADGLANADIATRLSRSTRTVEHHIESILGKLGARSRGEAVTIARDRGALPQNG